MRPFGNDRAPRDSAPPARSGILRLLLFLSLPIVSGCGPSDDGFRFDGRYEAVVSGYEIRIVSEGYIGEGSDTVGAAFAVVRICPTGRSNARAIRMTMLSAPGRPVVLEAEELGPVLMEWNAATAEGLLRGLLSAANFRNIQPDELRGSVAAIGGSLARPLEGRPGEQVGSLRVLGAGIENDYPIEKDAPPREWIPPTEVPACESR